MKEKLPTISGKELVKILNRAGFRAVSQKGSHVKMRKGRLVFTVPLHDSLKRGTFIAILKQANMSKEEFLELLR